MFEFSGTTGGIAGFWNGPVAATTYLASISPSEVTTLNPAFVEFLVTDLTSTPVLIGALNFLA